MSKKEDNKLNRLYKIDIDKNKELYEVCDRFSRLAKDLYNYTNYKIRTIYLISKRIEEGLEVNPEALEKYIKIKEEIDSFNEHTSTNKIKFENRWGGLYIGGKGAKTPLKSLLNSTECFTKLPASASYDVVEQVVGAWNGYFESLSSYTKDNSKFKGKPKPPKYKDKNGRSVFVIGKNATTIKDGCISFKKARKGLRSFEDFNCNNIKIPLPDWDRYKAPNGNLTYIRVVPKNNKFTMEILYKIDKSTLLEDNGRMVGIDIGVGRLATVSNNIGEQPFAINGNPLKSLNKEWNKQVAQYKSILMKTNGLETSKRFKQMNDKRNQQIDTYMHQSASYIIGWCKKHNITTIVIGKNKNWKQGINIGKETQTFAQIPFAKFIEKIKYRAEGLGITCVEQEESYTSKSSFIDSDYIPTYGKSDKCNFSGKRIKRGLYQSKDKLYIHADLNGSYNIIRKYNNKFTYSENEYLHPIVILPNQKVS